MSDFYEEHATPMKPSEVHLALIKWHKKPPALTDTQAIRWSTYQGTDELYVQVVSGRSKTDAIYEAYNWAKANLDSESHPSFDYLGRKGL